MFSFLFAFSVFFTPQSFGQLPYCFAQRSSYNAFSLFSFFFPLCSVLFALYFTPCASLADARCALSPFACGTAKLFLLAGI